MLIIFGLIEVVSHRGTLSKLLQIGTLDEYQYEFEGLSTLVNGLDEEFLMDCYVNRLKKEIQTKVWYYFPSKVEESMCNMSGRMPDFP